MTKGVSRAMFVLAAGMAAGHMSRAQEYLFPLNNDMNWSIAAALETDSNHLHTALRPYRMDELRALIPVDSLVAPELKPCSFYSTWGGRKLRKEHFLELNSDGLHLVLDPLFDFQGGRETGSDRNVYVNTRGLLLQARAGQHFYAYTGLYENQARYVTYVNRQVESTGVVPGQGRVKFLSDDVLDFNSAFGGIGFTPSRHFDFQLAQDKNFIGDGYRSLFLSDNAFSYPFLRATAQFWKLKYMVLYTLMQDLDVPYDYDTGFRRKYSVIHYLSLHVGRKEKLTFGLFESVTWKSDTLRGFDFSYLNPVIFLRPVENANGSPDNEMIGGSIRYRVNPHHVVYGQLLIDELILSEVRAGNGWWGNKQAFQVGYKGLNWFGIRHLNVQTEFNYVRPFVYAHRSRLQNYAHYNQALAHPLGANFYESVSFLNYSWKNFYFRLQYSYARAGVDTGGVNYGGDIFKDYDTRTMEYGNYMLTGVDTRIVNAGIEVQYLVNPKTHLVVKGGYSERRYDNSLDSQTARTVYIGIATALNNFYFDF
jgi:hypothetical protein